LYLLAGQVIVKTATQEVILGKGDLVTFFHELSCRLTVHQAVRKHERFG
jgi:uncharacterized cupin superfamily protein